MVSSYCFFCESLARWWHYKSNFICWLPTKLGLIFFLQISLLKTNTPHTLFFRIISPPLRFSCKIHFHCFVLQAIRLILKVWRTWQTADLTAVLEIHIVWLWHTNKSATHHIRLRSSVTPTDQPCKRDIVAPFPTKSPVTTFPISAAQIAALQVIQ